MKTIADALYKTKSKSRGFTIIELLVVIGIISVLAVALLVTLNPAEAQKRARDTKRLKDANTIQAIVEQYMNDGGSFSSCTTGAPCTSATSGAVDAAPCSGSTQWIGGSSVTLCDYAKTIPVDPDNNATRSCVEDSSTGDINSSCTMVYRFAISGSNYEINVRQESVSNLSKVTGDSGDSDEWVEIFTGSNAILDGSTD